MESMESMESMERADSTDSEDDNVDSNSIEEPEALVDSAVRCGEPIEYAI